MRSPRVASLAVIRLEPHQQCLPACSSIDSRNSRYLIAARKFTFIYDRALLRLESGGLLARSLSGMAPRLAGGSTLLLVWPLAFLICEILLVPSSSCSTTLRSELWTCRLSPTS